jgi:hypothetical protein
MTKALFGIIQSENQAYKIIERLKNSGFDQQDISIILPRQGLYKKSTLNGQEEKADILETPPLRGMSYEEPTSFKTGIIGHEKHTKAPEGGSAGAAAGGLLGGSLGLLAGIGSLAIPGFGPFIAAGPILAALSGSAIGGGLGLIIGWLVGLGIPEYEAKKYDTSLKEGNILICIHTKNSKEVNLAWDILKQENVKDMSTSEETVARA